MGVSSTTSNGECLRAEPRSEGICEGEPSGEVVSRRGDGERAAREAGGLTVQQKRRSDVMSIPFLRGNCLVRLRGTLTMPTRAVCSLLHTHARHGFSMAGGASATTAYLSPDVTPLRRIAMKYVISC